MHETHSTKFTNSAMSHQSVFGGRWLSEARIHGHGGNFLLMMCILDEKARGIWLLSFCLMFFLAEFANAELGGLALEYTVSTTHKKILLQSGFMYIYLSLSVFKVSKSLIYLIVNICQTIFYPTKVKTAARSTPGT